MTGLCDFMEFRSAMLLNLFGLYTNALLFYVCFILSVAAASLRHSIVKSQDRRGGRIYSGERPKPLEERRAGRIPPNSLSPFPIRAVSRCAPDTPRPKKLWSAVG